MSYYIASCSNCRFAVPRDGDSEYLECHRYPIQIAGFNADGDVVSSFPATEPTEWCGDHEERYGE